jgi:oligopeptide/dipeptide ABC transporter ATP-binding protein
LHPYTVALLSAAPVPNPRIERNRERIILTGEMPSPSEALRGCRFRSRCWLCRRLGDPEECRAMEPELTSMRPGRSVACHFSDLTDGSPEPSSARERSDSTPLPLPHIRPLVQQAASSTGRRRTDGASRSARLDDEGESNDA